MGKGLTAVLSGVLLVLCGLFSDCAGLHHAAPPSHLHTYHL